MRTFARLLLLAAALLIAVPAAVAARPDEAGRPADKPAKPDKAEKVEKDDSKPDVPPGQAKQGEEGGNDAHPLGGAPGKLKEPGEPAHPELTKLTETVSATPGPGTLKIKVPGSDEYTELDEGEALPTGSVVDATDGLVEIGSETSDGTEQNAVVTGGVFQVEQSADGVTDLTLKEGDFRHCTTRSKNATARTASRRKSKANVARGLWAAGKGRFRTNGRNATASVRGTRWAIVDRCHSTTVKVFDGVVDVFDRELGKTVAVRAGERHVARERRP